MRPARAFLAAGLIAAMLGTAACTPNTGKGAAIGAAAGAGLEPIPVGWCGAR